MKKLEEIVIKLMKNNFLLDKSTTSILVISDKSTYDLANSFKEALSENGWSTHFLSMSDRKKSGEEPTEEIATAMYNHDLSFCLTKHSLTHTLARKKANENGKYIVTMPGVNEDMFLHGALNADYSVVEKETIVMTQKLQKAKNVTIETGKGLKLEIPVENRNAIPSTGVFKEKGASGNLPSGEAYIAPLEGLAEGKIEINGSISGIGIVNEPVILSISRGQLIEASGNTGKKLLEILGDGKGRNLAELGIGTNYAARITGNILEDEKAYNTVHVAFGSNHTFGGRVNAGVHIDCVTKDPRIIFS